jgi:hypothetical protein
MSALRPGPYSSYSAGSIARFSNSSNYARVRQGLDHPTDGELLLAQEP